MKLVPRSLAAKVWTWTLTSFSVRPNSPIFRKKEMVVVFSLWFNQQNNSVENWYYSGCEFRCLRQTQIRFTIILVGFPRGGRCIQMYSSFIKLGVNQTLMTSSMRSFGSSTIVICHSRSCDMVSQPYKPCDLPNKDIDYTPSKSCSQSDASLHSLRNHCNNISWREINDFGRCNMSIYERLSLPMRKITNQENSLHWEKIEPRYADADGS
jgi:hypothetical protein